jgi:hypothetical protein
VLSQNGLTRNRLAFTLVVRHVAQRRGRLRRGGFFDELEEFEIVGQLLVSQVGVPQRFKAGDDGRALLVDGTQQSIALSAASSSRLATRCWISSDSARCWSSVTASPDVPVAGSAPVSGSCPGTSTVFFGRPIVLAPVMIEP